MYTYDQFLELDSDAQLALVQNEGTVIMEQKCSYFHSTIYGMGNFSVELTEDLATGKFKIKSMYSRRVNRNIRPAYYK